jgi:hypothetical protein
MSNFNVIAGESAISLKSCAPGTRHGFRVSGREPETNAAKEFAIHLRNKGERSVKAGIKGSPSGSAQQNTGENQRRKPRNIAREQRRPGMLLGVNPSENPAPLRSPDWLKT